MRKRVLPLLTALCLMVGALAVPAGAEGLLTLSVGEEELLTIPDRAEDGAGEAEAVDSGEGETAEEPAGEEAGEEPTEEGEAAEGADTAEEGEAAEGEPEPQPEPEPEPETNPNPNPLKVRVNEQRVYIDNDEVPYGFYMCALINEEGNSTNYIRVRDLATALLDTPAQFGVTWNGQVTLTRGGESDAGGTGEASGVFTYAANYEVIREDTLVNGRTVTLEGVRFTDSKGGGHTYYKLRDLGEALDFNVGWSVARGVYIETDKPYDPNN